MITVRNSFERAQRWLAIVTGLVLIACAFTLNRIVTGQVPFTVEAFLLLAGCVFFVFGVVRVPDRVRAGLAKVSLTILSVVVVVSALELTFRGIDFDFNQLRKPGNEVPIYYRRATVHAGEGIFRREGPAAWEGRVLAGYMRMNGGSEGPYSNEVPVLVEYDAEGFRNPTNLTDWDIVVTGDSFLELGYLPYEDLFTTIAGKRLGKRIKNLGVSGTGPVSQTFFVKKYGKALSTKHAILCFYEGNDLEDLSRELRNVEAYWSSGELGAFPRQTSFLNASIDRLRSVCLRDRNGLEPAFLKPNAVLLSAGQEKPTTVYGRPPAWDKMGESMRERLIGVLRNWSEMTRSNDMNPWVIYIPDSRRTFHGMLRYSHTNSPQDLWKPGNFASGLGSTCSNLSINFIDTYPELRRQSERGIVPYNLIGDTHLSREGSRIVAEVLVDSLQAAKKE